MNVGGLYQMARESLHLRVRGNELSVISRSSKGGNFYLVNITSAGFLQRADGVREESTNFQIDPAVRDKVFLG